MAYDPAPKIYELGEDFYDPVQAANFPNTKLRYRDDKSAAAVGLDLSNTEWVEHFGRFKPLVDNLKEPLALCYHGHQFQHYNPDLGDGRGFLFAQLRGPDGRLMDLGTKGSGQTPWSRAGDGRLTLLGGVREVMATRYLEHLGVNTSKTFSLIETGEDLHRNDEPSPTRSAVMVRLSHSHIRFGTFQRQAFFNDTNNLEKLTDYCLRHYHSDAEGPDGLLRAAAVKSADMVASWMAAGFVHGVMNTDNMNITGESFDYGPYRFLPTLRSDYTAAYFDHNNLYAFAKQPEIMYWNLGQLAQSLSPICEDEKLLAALEDFAPAYRDSLRAHMFRRFAIEPKNAEDDIEFIMQTFRFLENSQCSWPQFWHDWQGGAGQLVRAKASPNSEFYTGEAFADWLTAYGQYEPAGKAPDGDVPVSLLYDEIGELWKPIDEQDDWAAFEDKLRTFQRA
ncbi:protein adenylyltransferase SelO family protein [Hellea balneolensis]|uniref:protein adenylyltransferase SelO family protein n=1 Tax=Hellea balneolensis TaxID=287478 RepID=UPI00041AEAC8|nr:YdiU family protein [Hellea balneolensis]